MKAIGEKSNNRNTFVIQILKLRSRSDLKFSIQVSVQTFRLANVGIACFLFLVFPNCFSQTNLIKKVRYFDINKLVTSEIYYVSEKDGLTKSGLFTAFYSSGKTKTKGTYQNDLPVGTWERYFENGTLKSNYSYETGKLNGLGLLFFENGNRAQTGFFKNNLEDSIWTFRYESGRIKSIGHYKNGLQHGLWTYFHEDSSLKATALIFNGRGHYKEYFPNKTIRMEGVIDNGLSDSIWNYYYENGCLKAMGEENAGERDGFWRFNHLNGKVSTEGHFSKNKKVGHWKYFHENGILSSEGTLESDEKEGVWKFFMPSGALMGQGVFSKGSGDYQEFYDNGKIKLKGKIDNNNYEGPWTYYFEDGGLEGECSYKGGYGQYTGYYENGGIKMKGQMNNGQKVGSWDLLGKDAKLIGHYKTFYDMMKPPATIKSKGLNDSITPKPRHYGRPEYNFSGKKFRHYVSKLNEMRGFIISCNPFAIALTSFPIGIEYFFQDRLGLELVFTFFRQPFFANHAEELENKRVYTLGNSIDFKQKLYSADHGSGNLYVGQELRFTNFSHSLLVIESTDSTTFSNIYEGKETKIELSILVGNRFFQFYNRGHSFTLDLYTGIGFGYRFSKFPDQLLIYNRLKTNTLTIPFRLGFNFGYIF